MQMNGSDVFISPSFNEIYSMPDARLFVDTFDIWIEWLEQ